LIIDANLDPACFQVEAIVIKVVCGDCLDPSLEPLRCVQISVDARKLVDSADFTYTLRL
jgi:hypothetical protein